MDSYLISKCHTIWKCYNLNKEKSTGSCLSVSSFYTNWDRGYSSCRVGTLWLGHPPGMGMFGKRKIPRINIINIRVINAWTYVVITTPFFINIKINEIWDKLHETKWLNINYATHKISTQFFELMGGDSILIKILHLVK